MAVTYCVQCISHVHDILCVGSTPTFTEFVGYHSATVYHPIWGSGGDQIRDPLNTNVMR